MIRKLLNPKASATNTLKLLESQSGCCGDIGKVCKYTFTDANAIVVRGIKITEDDVIVITMLTDVPGGAAMITAYGALGTDAAKVQYLKSTIFPALFAAAGYLIEAQADITVSSDLKTIVITGEAPMTAITTSTPSDITPTTACNKIVVCDYCVSYAGGAGPIVITVDGDSYTLTAAVDFAYPTGLADLNTQLEAELDGVVLGYGAVDDTANGAFVITIIDPSGETIVVDGVTAPCCNVRNDWEAEA